LNLGPKYEFADESKPLPISKDSTLDAEVVDTSVHPRFESPLRIRHRVKSAVDYIFKPSDKDKKSGDVILQESHGPITTESVETVSESLMSADEQTVEKSIMSQDLDNVADMPGEIDTAIKVLSEELEVKDMHSIETENSPASPLESLSSSLFGFPRRVSSTINQFFQKSESTTEEGPDATPQSVDLQKSTKESEKSPSAVDDVIPEPVSTSELETSEDELDNPNVEENTPEHSKFESPLRIRHRVSTAVKYLVDPISKAVSTTDQQSKDSQRVSNHISEMQKTFSNDEKMRNADSESISSSTRSSIDGNAKVPS
jgi:hypothetical protein